MSTREPDEAAVEHIAMVAAAAASDLRERAEGLVSHLDNRLKRLEKGEDYEAVIGIVIEEFAAIRAEAESVMRERCAQLCDDVGSGGRQIMKLPTESMGTALADMIRNSL